MLPLYGFGLGPALFLYPFRFYDPVRGRWIRARYVAERREIAERYAQWEIIGEPEVRRVSTDTFTPWH